MADVKNKLLTDTTNIKNIRSVSILDNTKGKSIGEAIKQVLQNICHNLSCLFSSNQQDTAKLAQYLQNNLVPDCRNLAQLVQTYQQNSNLPVNCIREEKFAIANIANSLAEISLKFSDNEGGSQLRKAARVLLNCAKKIQIKDEEKAQDSNFNTRLANVRQKIQSNQNGAQTDEIIDNLQDLSKILLDRISQ